MIDTLLNGLFKVILSFVIGTFNIITFPITSLILISLPFAYTDFVEPLNNLINAFINFIPFIADLTFLPAITLHLIVSYLIFKYTLKFSVWAIKLVVGWWNALKG